jgi:hypothetical protein
VGFRGLQMAYGHFLMQSGLPLLIFVTTHALVGYCIAALCNGFLHKISAWTLIHRPLRVRILVPA